MMHGKNILRWSKTHKTSIIFKESSTSAIGNLSRWVFVSHYFSTMFSLDEVSSQPKNYYLENNRMSRF